MAFRGEATDGGPYYNVNFAVGLNAPNKRDDVFLVQWMLFRIWTDYSLPPLEGRMIKVDGWIGQQTIRYIAAFQAGVRAKGFSCHYDGRVDSARRAVASITKTFYTISWLNSYVAGGNPAVYADPAVDPDCPQEVLNSLATKTSAEGPYAPAPEPVVPATGGA